ncbi:hypothetical protein [Pseudomarimonas arenosa]|uniref:DUF2306 domain-containing protein n=1 Tax=Pseudomarimonas arenosa TaxID=2774145 RepID=A0AAW3ZRE4_9GAMM|nr:hypothetical protein [Pseudomarimonas arenosa]MBD8528110.1 hypothetical protein [Pseudomarimonas arenosa]
MDSYRIALIAHILSGVIALAAFWSAGLARKGSPFHKKIGKVYLLSMLGIILTGVPLVFGLLARGQSVGAIFLTYLLVLVSSACWQSWRAVRDKKNANAYFGFTYWSLVGISALSGAGVIAFGAMVGSSLLQVFGGIGVFGLVGGIFSWRRAPRDPKWWLKEHYGAMIGNGVATHIAFFGIGLRNMLPGVDPALVQSFAWFSPLVGALIAAIWLNRRYGRSPAKARTPAKPMTTDAQPA